MDFKITKTSLILTVVICYSCSCGQHKIRNAIIDFYSNENHLDSVWMLDFSKIINENYEEYNIIHGQLTREEITQYTGHKYTGTFLWDDQYRFIFWGRNDCVVYEETIHDNRGVLDNYNPTWDHGVLIPNPELYVRVVDGEYWISGIPSP